MPTEKFQRQTVLIKHSLQFKYMAVVFFSVLLASLIVGTDVYYTMAKMLLQENPSLIADISRLTPILLIKLILYLVLILLITLYISHRFAGPIHRFEKSARILGTGDLTYRVSLRSSDELMDLQEEFNSMTASIQSLIQKDRALADHIQERLDSILKKIPQNGDWSVLKEDISSIKNEISHLTRAFKV